GILGIEFRPTGHHRLALRATTTRFGFASAVGADFRIFCEPLGSPKGHNSPHLALHTRERFPFADSGFAFPAHPLQSRISDRTRVRWPNWQVHCRAVSARD